MQLVDYANWAAGEVTQLPPAQMTHAWAGAWDATLTAMRAPGVYEHAGLIGAKWEFLGGLYRGVPTTTVQDARAYADVFLPQWGPLHNVSGACAAGCSEFFAMFRNKCLHGFTPAAIFRPQAAHGDVATWVIPMLPHLHVTPMLAIQVDSATLQAEFVQSVHDYANYLAANVDPLFAVSPEYRWKRSFWGRFHPINQPIAAWEQDGRNRQLFP